MADFNSEFWHWYVSILSVLSILACVVLLRWMSTGAPKTDKVENTGHVWDGDLTELNNPLPRWWLYLLRSPRGRTYVRNGSVIDLQSMWW